MVGILNDGLQVAGAIRKESVGTGEESSHQTEQTPATGAVLPTKSANNIPFKSLGIFFMFLKEVLYPNRCLKISIYILIYLKMYFIPMMT